MTELTLYIINHKFHFEMENLTMLFFPDRKIVRMNLFTEQGAADRIITSLSREDGRCVIFTEVCLDGQTLRAEKDLKADTSDSELERCMSVCLFEILSELTGYRPAWGILTGVRPARFFADQLTKHGPDAAREIFEQKWLVTPPKIQLSERVAEKTLPILKKITPDSFSLYISIPFCPSRCSYCSFISHTAPKALSLIPEYVDKLCEEIRIFGDIAAKHSLRLLSVYIGGGTPTVCTPEHLDRLGITIKECFDFSNLSEYTAEAGRPDTITPEKLKILSKNGANRISINPQSLDNAVLENIGRKHTAEQFHEAFEMARAAGFTNINTDLIAGLPGDTPEGFRRSLLGIIEKNPENITVHTLSVKRSAHLREYSHILDSAQSVAEMLDTAEKILEKSGLEPYYLYRQSRTLGNFENTGYGRPGFEGLYNIFMMNDAQSVFGCGAGAVTKLHKSDTGELFRIFNHKYPYEYINRFGEITDRKAQVYKFYDEYLK